MSKMKRLFNTYKKAVLSTLCAVAILALLGTSMVYAAGAVAESSAIGSENARNFAFVDAGIDPVSATMVRTEFEHELGQFVYEVEFTADGTEYEYWIKASDGTTLKKEVELKEVERKIEPILQPVTEQKPQPTPKPTPKPKPEATPEPKLEATPQPTPQPQPAETLQPQPAPSAASNITIDHAKEIAVARAGLSVSDVTFEKAKMEHDDGIMVYEIEFYHGGMEYDCEIKATDGTILDYDCEKDD